MTTTKQDQEMRDLLIRLDQRVDDGFRSINSKLDDMNRRADGHELRIRSLEDWRTEVRGGAKGITLGWKVGSALVGALAGILGYMGVQLAVVKKAPVVKSETTIERSITLPKH
ncbi:MULTISPECIES: hypothetical protein [Sphingobium]|jgi:hypothetical protein|uniref:hypothetical protein n=1 Tax=Sphingobium TaxID=165695 RepID=UPI000DB31C49|nr:MULTISPECIES: hypothetical protein [Sphingobium]MCC4257018.1 hypothetical protein [Sphingobium lactosutens]PZU67236.1 MAG: hypothetical protein DI540_11640 [Sphingobium sp.]